MPVIHALGEGYDVFAVTDASGGVSVEAHERAIQRMVQAGAVPIYLDGRAKRVAARPGARSDCARAWRNPARARRINGNELRLGTPTSRRGIPPTFAHGVKRSNIMVDRKKLHVEKLYATPIVLGTC